MACGERSAETAKGEAAATLGAILPETSTAKVPDVVLTSEAIGHAAVRWAAAVSQEAAAAIEVPGQLTPNEDRTVRLGAPVERCVGGS